MILLDLRKPLSEAGVVHQTERHPISELKYLANPARAVMLIYNDDWQRHTFSCLRYDPVTGEFGTYDASTVEEAYRGAQAQFQEAGGQLLATH